MDFENLLSQSIAALITSGPGEVAGRIHDTQRQLCTLLDADRSTIWLVAQEPTGPSFHLAHQVCLTDAPPVPATLRLEQACPWGTRQALAGQEVLVEDVDLLPPEAAQDRASLKQHLNTSTLAMPFLDRGGEVFGLLAFGVLVRKRPWPAELLSRCRLVAQVICAVLLRERSEHAARQKHDQLQKLWQVLEHVPASVVITDARGDIEYVNPRFTQLTGYQLDEVRGRNPRVLKSGHTSTAEYTELWKTLARGETWWGEFHNRRKDGTLFWERAVIAPVRDSSGAVTHFIAMKEDITEHKRAAAELAQVRDQLLQSQKLDALGRLAGGVAHDFNNLLTVIQSVGDELAEQVGPQSPLLTDVQEILDASHRAVALTRQLLAFSRQQPHRPQRVDLVALAKDAAKLLRRVLREDIKLSVGVAVKEAPVFADPMQLHQVMVNLAVNARDAMPRGGALYFEVSERLLTRGTDGPRRHATLTVRDTGSGIAPEHKARVFEPFFTTKEAGKGTGLGLATVLGIVTRSEGLVQLESELGLGTTVHVHLPWADGPTEPAQPPQAEELLRGAERILLVEDDLNVRRVLCRTLSRCGYEVLVAEDGRGALALLEAQSQRIDLVLTDVVMPRMSGFELTLAIRERWPTMPVLFTSGFSDVDGSELEALSGAPVLPKPATAHELSLAVRAALDRARR